MEIQKLCVAALAAGFATFASADVPSDVIIETGDEYFLQWPDAATGDLSTVRDFKRVRISEVLDQGTFHFVWASTGRFQTMTGVVKQSPAVKRRYLFPLEDETELAEITKSDEELFPKVLGGVLGAIFGVVVDTTETTDQQGNSTYEACQRNNDPNC